jgi:lipoyl(octanoyl) transferase
VPRHLRFVHAGFGDDAVPYDRAWDEQRRLHEARIADLVPDTVLLLEHPPVYTAGKRTEPPDRPADGTPVVDVDRGGKITWHGPGQLVGYPIVKLPERLYVVDYVRRLEAAIIGACSELGLPTARVKGRSGVWVLGERGARDRKVAAIGVRVARGVTMHGFAINCDCDLSWFGRIIPCGITDAGVTSLSRELGRRVSVLELTPVMERRLAQALEVTSYDWGAQQRLAAEPTLA